MRTTVDSRIVAGGEDVDFVDEAKRDQLLPSKTKTLKRKVRGNVSAHSLETGHRLDGYSHHSWPDFRAKEYRRKDISIRPVPVKPNALPSFGHIRRKLYDKSALFSNYNECFRTNGHPPIPNV